MSAALVSVKDDSESICDPSNFEAFFTQRQKEELREKYVEARERIPIGSNPAEHCKDNLFFGFFHDGTRNNLYHSLQKGDHSESNIGRLYLAYPGLGPLGIAADRSVE